MHDEAWPGLAQFTSTYIGTTTVSPEYSTLHDWMWQGHASLYVYIIQVWPLNSLAFWHCGPLPAPRPHSCVARSCCTCQLQIRGSAKTREANSRKEHFERFFLLPLALIALQACM
jgi:hypothetical protein